MSGRTFFEADSLLFFSWFTVNWWLPRSSPRMMPSINVWQRVNRALCCPWLALLSSCPRTGPVHREISMLRPSQALLSYWPGRDHSTMQTKSSPTPSITWRLKVRPRGEISHLCFRFCISAKKGARWLSTTISSVTLSCVINSTWWRPSVDAVQSRGQGGLRNNNSLSQPIVHSPAHSSCT